MDSFATHPGKEPVRNQIARTIVYGAVRALLSGRGEVALYSDLLLHDMGPALNDGIVQSSATGAEWRTTPLWGLRLRTRFLHDGRAATPAEAILTHDGEGAAAARAFRQLAHDDRKALLDFLSVL
jgi:CxxC motif-containing protein (DUF1111 family)